MWRQDTSMAVPPRTRLSRAGARWGLEAIVCQHLSMARAAEGLGVSWNTANQAVLAEGQRVLVSAPARFDAVKVIGVDEHVWRHTRKGDKYVTVIINLTPVRDDTGPSRLLDMVQGRSGIVFKSWLESRPQSWRDRIQVVAMDGFTGFKTAAAETLPQAVEVMDPFHVVRLAGNALEDTRRRVQHDALGRRGRKDDPLFTARRTLLTSENLLADKQHERLSQVLTDDSHVEVEATWGVYQRIVACYRSENHADGKTMTQTLIDARATSIPTALTKLRKLGRTLKKQPTTSWPTSTGPTHPTAPPKPSTAAPNTSTA